MGYIVSAHLIHLGYKFLLNFSSVSYYSSHCITPVYCRFSCMGQSPGRLTRKTHARSMPSINSFSMLLGIKWYHFISNDEVRRQTNQPLLTEIIQARRITLFGHIARMDDNVDAKQILTSSPSVYWKRHQDDRG